MPEGSGEGVYIQAQAEEVDDAIEIERILKYLYDRKNKQPRRADEFMGDYPRRVYKAVPEKFWLNDSGDVNGNFVDTRVEVKLI